MKAHLSRPARTIAEVGFARPPILVLFLLIVWGCDGTSPTQVMPLPPQRGEVTVLQQICTDEECRNTCGPAGCMKVRVSSCAGILHVTARVRVSGSGETGTLVLLTGGPGRGLFGNSSDPDVVGFMDALRSERLRLVEIGWNEDGPWGLPADGSIRAGARTLACRPGTLIPWVHENLHTGGLFMAQGNSGGSSQIAFPLSYYGLDELVDMVNLGGGPAPCPIAIGGDPNFGQNIECIGGPGVWNETLEPLRSGAPDLDYPNTVVNFFIGAEEPNTTIVIPSAHAHFAAISARDKTFTTVPNTGHNVFLTSEGAAAQLEAIRRALSGQ